MPHAGLEINARGPPARARVTAYIVILDSRGSIFGGRTMRTYERDRSKLRHGILEPALAAPAIVEEPGGRARRAPPVIAHWRPACPAPLSHRAGIRTSRWPGARVRMAARSVVIGLQWGRMTRNTLRFVRVPWVSSACVQRGWSPPSRRNCRCQGTLGFFGVGAFRAAHPKAQETSRQSGCLGFLRPPLLLLVTRSARAPAGGSSVWRGSPIAVGAHAR